MTAEEQAIQTKILAYPLAAWNITTEYDGPSVSVTTLLTINPAGSKVEVVKKLTSYTKYDKEDRQSQATDSTYILKIDGQELRGANSNLAYSLSPTLKIRIENDLGSLKRIEEETRAVAYAKTSAEAKARQYLLDKL